VVFVFRELDELEYESLTLDQLPTVSEGEETEFVYVIHAMTLPDKLLRQYRRMRK
jgi:hypothetical protein